ncbi:MAG: hybrid sensor histidine kinase/response regulator [Bacteroidetes bacterium]|nr:hybrid sensor histidine kinase/response regulator [Bacteroidota bacterium]
MRNWKKINLLGNLNSRQETVDDAVSKFVQSLVNQVETSHDGSDRVNLLVSILRKAQSFSGQSLPPVSSSVFNEFFQFLTSLPSEFNPENPFDEKYEQLASQIKETTGYLITSIHDIQNESELSDLYKWAGLNSPVPDLTEQPTIVKTDSDIILQPETGLAQDPETMLSDLFEDKAAENGEISAKYEITPTTEAKTVQVKQTGELKTTASKLEFGFSLSSLFKPVTGELTGLPLLHSDPTFEEDFNKHATTNLSEELGIGSDIEEPVQPSTPLTEELSEISFHEEEGDLVIEELIHEDALPEVAGNFVETEDSTLVEDEVSETPEPSESLSFEEPGEELSAGLTETNVEEFSEMTESVDGLQEEDESINSDLIPEEVSQVEETELFEGLSGEETESVAAPQDNMAWILRQILVSWEDNLTEKPNYAIIHQGLSELSAMPNPVPSFRDVSSLPEYQEFIDFLEATDQNPVFDRDLVSQQTDQIANRVFELFTEILFSQTQGELDEYSSDLNDETVLNEETLESESLTSIQEDSGEIIPDSEEIISDSLVEDKIVSETVQDELVDSNELTEELIEDVSLPEELGEELLSEEQIIEEEQLIEEAENVESTEQVLSDGDELDIQNSSESDTVEEKTEIIEDFTKELNDEEPISDEVSEVLTEEELVTEENAEVLIEEDSFIGEPSEELQTESSRTEIDLNDHDESISIPEEEFDEGESRVGAESVDYFRAIQIIYHDIKKLNSVQGNNTGINQFVDFSLSLKDPVEVLREHLNIQIAKDFVEYVDYLHAKFDGGEKEAYEEMMSHRMEIADQLYQLLTENPEITGEEVPETFTRTIEAPDHFTPSTLHLVTDEDIEESLLQMGGGAEAKLTESVQEETEPELDSDAEVVSEEPAAEVIEPESETEMISDETEILDDSVLEEAEQALTEEVSDEEIEIPVEEELVDSAEEVIEENEEALIEDVTEEISELSEVAEEPLSESEELIQEEAITDELSEISEDLSENISLTEEVTELTEEPELTEIQDELTELLEEETLEIKDSAETLLELQDETTSLPEPAIKPVEKEKPVQTEAQARKQKKELNEIQQIFLIEADENIQKISGDLLELEKDLSNISIIDGILRSAHTLKGSAAMMKFANMSKLGHKMEDVFTLLRDEKIPADRDLIDIMLKGTDIQSLMLTTLREEGHDEVPGLEESIFSLAQYLKKLEAKSEGKEFVADQFVASEPAVKEIVPVSAGEKAEVQQQESRAPQMQDGRPKGVVAEQTLRINITTLNNLINLAAELLISRNRMNNQLGFMEGTLLKLQKEKLLLNSIMKKVSQFAGKTTDSASGYFSSEEQGILQDFAETEFDRFSDLDIILRDMKSNLSNFEDLSSEIRGFSDAFRQSIMSVSTIANELNVEIMSMRMVPVKHMFIRFQRSIRDIGREESKDVDLKIEGEDTRLDKTVMEEVIEPIMHCVRNAVSHGIELPENRKNKGKSETGLITLRAYQDGNQVVLEVEDDGNGIDAQRLKAAAINKRIVSPERAESMTDSEAMELMFIPGFSTAEKVTSLSGRGVGMDVVKNVVTKFKGNISVKSTLGKGSCFTIRLPLTLAINQSLLIQAAGRTFAFPLSSVDETVELVLENIQRIGEQELITVRDQTIPLIHLSHVIGVEEDPATMKLKYPVVILSDSDQKIAIRVDRLIGKEEIVVKTLGSHLKNVMGVMGATVLGDGSVILILDVSYLFRYWQGGKTPGVGALRSSFSSSPRMDTSEYMMEDVETEEAPKRPEQQKTKVRGRIRVLCADDSVSIRKYVESLLKREEYEVVTAQDGAEAYDLAEKSKYDLIMTDLEMPKMHGYELISALRSKSQFNSIPIVILTARSGEKHRRRGLELGANAFLNKPFDVDELLNTIHSLLGK